MNLPSSKTALSLPVLALVGLTSPQSYSAGLALEEIVVTAQRKAETLQESALSIQAKTGDQLQRLGVFRPDDLGAQFAGVEIGGGTTTQIYVRGVGDFGVVATANPAVVTSLDGVSISRPQAISGNFFDIERVEMLKGPQGTLYGRNASGGALNIISKRPELGELSGNLNLSVGNYALRSVDGAINTPIDDDHAIRLAFQVSDRDGYLSDDTEDEDRHSVRLQTYSQWSDSLNVRLQATHSALKGKGTGLAVVNDISGRDEWVGSASVEAAELMAALANQNFALSGGASPPPFLIDAPNADELFQDVTSWSMSAEVNVDLGGPTLTVIPGYRKTEARFGIQPGFLYSPGYNDTKGEESTQTSLEIRLSEQTDSLDWVLGVYGFQEKQQTDFFVGAGLIQRFRAKSDLDTDAYSAFAEATYSLTDSFRLTAGLRYTSDKRSLTNFSKVAVSPTVLETDVSDGISDDDPCLPPLAGIGEECSLLLGAPASAFDSSKTFNETTWKVGFEMDVLDESMLFGSITYGFKAGGFNQAIDPESPNKTLAFEPETITAYTLGLKNTFFDGSLQFNAEAFFWDYDDLQLSSLIIDGVGQVSLATQNAGKAEIKGLSFEVISAPWQGGLFNVNLEYVDSEYKEYAFLQAAAFTNPAATGCSVAPSSVAPGPAGPFVQVDCSGFPLVRSPEWSASFGVSQRFELAGNGHIIAALDGSFSSEKYLHTDFTPSEYVSDSLILSFSSTYYSADDSWYVSGWVRNLTDEANYTGGGGNQHPFISGYITSSINPPRTYGVSVGYEF